MARPRSMRVGVPLSELRYELLAETFQSLNPQQTTSSTPFYNYQLDRAQREQWNLIVWPHLTIYKDIPMIQGQRYYNYPVQLPFDSIVRIWWPQGTQWLPLHYGINPSTYAALGGESIQSWPPQRWRNVALFNETTGQTSPAAQFEVWPVPTAQPISLRVEGNAPLNQLVADTDVCVIDATLIVLMAAAEILAVQKSEGAAMKLQKANSYRRMLIARLGAQQRSMYSLSRDGGRLQDPTYSKHMTPYLDFIPPH